jgi:Na+-translocating ferredoxin:NAD+ oxidoreductase RnfG subunit
MKTIILILLFAFNLIKAEGIKSDVEEILGVEFSSHSTITMKKFELPSVLKAQTEKKVQQRFFKDYVYLWKICQSDSLAGYAILDNTYGKSLPITFLVIFTPAGEIRRMDIIRYREPYGGAIGSRHWLDQFIGKSVNDEFKVDNDVDTISGATISVHSITRATQKLVILMTQLIEDKSFKCYKQQLTNCKAK